MADQTLRREVDVLKPAERYVAAGVAAAFLGAAVYLVLAPPDRRVALAQCPRAGAGCIVNVDYDATTFACVLAGIGAAAALIAILGIRFNRVKVGSAELGYERETRGLTQAEPAGELTAEPASIAPADHTQPIEVAVLDGLGATSGAVPVAVTQLSRPIGDVDPAFLRDYQSARKLSQRSYFLTHILAPATTPGQRYSVAIRVTPHSDATSEVRSASFYLGRSWGSRVFKGSRGPDGRFGIATEAWGPFLALCEIEFDDGSRILLDHYCDFDMGTLLKT